MPAGFKNLSIKVIVQVPHDTPAKQVRDEIAHLINNHSIDNTRVLRVEPIVVQKKS